MLAERNAKWIKKFEDALGIRFSSYAAPEAMAERLKVAESLEFGHVSRLMQACAGVVQVIGELGMAMEDGRNG